MRAARRAKLHDALAAKDAAAAVLLGNTNVRWATGARVVAADQGRAAHFRNVAVVTSGDGWPHLFTHFVDGVPDDHPADHVHAGLDVETDEDARSLVTFVAELISAGDRVILDEWTMALRAAWGDATVDDAAVTLMGEVKLVKTPDELACIRTAQSINERAMLDVQAAMR